MSVFITGSSGFVGKSFIANFSEEKLIQWKRGNEININSALVVMHLAGKAHDQKKTSNSDEYYKINTELTKAPSYWVGRHGYPVLAEHDK